LTLDPADTPESGAQFAAILSTDSPKARKITDLPPRTHLAGRAATPRSTTVLPARIQDHRFANGSANFRASRYRRTL